MYFNDHAPAHFHAEYGEYEAVYIIETLEIMRGGLPRRAHSMVVEWATLHRDALRQNWDRVVNRETLQRIEPLE